MANLPAWLHALLPTPAPALEVDFREGRIAVVTPAGVVAATFPQGALAELAATLEGRDFSFTEAFMEAHEEHSLGGFALSYPTSKSFSRLLFPSTDRDRLALLEDSYESSLRAAIRYQANPTDFYSAYHFVDTHPAFWINKRLESDPWLWETQGHCNRVYQYVSRDEDGRVFVALETGAHLRPEGEEQHFVPYSGHYHDYRLDAYGSTFEEAILELAALVAKFFYPDGSERPEVEHEKPEWVLELEERVAEVKKLQAEEEAEAAAEEASPEEEDPTREA